MASLGGSADKESACNAGDLDSIARLGRSHGEGKGYPLQYSGLENSMDCIIRGVTKSRTRLSDFHLDFFWDDLEGPPQLWNILTALSEAPVETDCGSSCLFAQSCLPPLPNWEISVDLKNIHNLKVESYTLCSGDFEGFKPERQHLKSP